MFRTKSPSPSLAALALAIAAGLALSGAASAQGQTRQGRGPGPQAMLEQMDTNRDGAISRTEFLEHRQAQFALFDADGNGALDAGEQAALTEAGPGRGRGGPGQGMGPGQAQGQRPQGGARGAVTLDADGDRRVSVEEFADASAQIFARLDRNNDGALSRADLPARN